MSEILPYSFCLKESMKLFVKIGGDNLFGEWYPVAGVNIETDNVRL